MRRLGYQVVWTDTRKEITFINPQGRKRRNLILDKALTKEALQESFAGNKELSDPKAMADQIRKLESAANAPNMVTIEDELIAGQDVEGEYEERQTKNRIKDTVMKRDLYIWSLVINSYEVRKIRLYAEVSLFEL